MLVDRGANGGLGGGDVLLLATVEGRKVDITGIDNHQLTNIPIATVAAKVRTTSGEIIMIFHQFAYTGVGRTIISPGQSEFYKHIFHDQHRSTGGHQLIQTMDNHVVPLQGMEGLLYVDISKPSKRDMEILPQVEMTSDATWDPAILDKKINLDDPTDPIFSYVCEKPKRNLRHGLMEHSTCATSVTDSLSSDEEDSLGFTREDDEDLDLFLDCVGIDYSINAAPFIFDAESKVIEDSVEEYPSPFVQPEEPSDDFEIDDVPPSHPIDLSGDDDDDDADNQFFFDAYDGRRVSTEPAIKTKKSDEN
jgi:hypothetical protein